MLKNVYLLTKIGADTAENEQLFAEILPKTGNYPIAGDPTRGPGRIPGGGPPARGSARARGPGLDTSKKRRYGTFNIFLHVSECREFKQSQYLEDVLICSFEDGFPVERTYSSTRNDLS